jgi:hypothetical protein
MLAGSRTSSPSNSEASPPTSAPAQGRWKSGGQTQGDEIAIFEVVVDRLDRGWWSRFREELEERLCQETILVTARDIEIL